MRERRDPRVNIDAGNTRVTLVGTNNLWLTKVLEQKFAIQTTQFLDELEDALVKIANAEVEAVK